MYLLFYLIKCNTKKYVSIRDSECKLIYKLGVNCSLYLLYSYDIILKNNS